MRKGSCIERLRVLDEVDFVESRYARGFRRPQFGKQLIHGLLYAREQGKQMASQQ